MDYWGGGPKGMLAPLSNYWGGPGPPSSYAYVCLCNKEASNIVRVPIFYLLLYALVKYIAYSSFNISFIKSEMA